MHITLHFLGRAEVGAVSQALKAVVAPSFTIRFGQPGHFSLRGGKTILWAGIEPSDALLGLHRATAEALEAVGFEPESRRYQPHLTLARLARSAPRTLVDAFERNSLRVAFDCERFALFASQTHPDGARYQVLSSFDLDQAA